MRGLPGGLWWTLGLLALLPGLLAACTVPLLPAPGTPGLPIATPTATPGALLPTPTAPPTATPGATLSVLHLHPANGTDVVVYVELARTEAARELGLMNRPSLPADQGMLFVWNGPTQEGFWMQNTLIPLSIGWFAQDGTLQEIQDMAPQTTTLHTPAAPYWYALEVNQGFFAAHGVAPSAKATLPVP